MRKYLLILTVLVVCYSGSNGQFYFSVSPSIFNEFLNFSEDNGMTYKTNSAAFGYRFGKLTPYLGLQYWKYTNTTETVNYLSSQKYEGTYSTFIPEIGCKYAVYEAKNFKFDLDLALNKVFYTYENKKNNVIEKDERSALYNNLNTIGVRVGVGGEYFFADYFSLGGSFNLMTYFNSADYDDSMKYKISSTNINTFTKISLNFYFGK